jgi:hypothetical protein
MDDLDRAELEKLKAQQLTEQVRQAVRLRDELKKSATASLGSGVVLSAFWIIVAIAGTNLSWHIALLVVLSIGTISYSIYQLCRRMDMLVVVVEKIGGLQIDRLIHK